MRILDWLRPLQREHWFVCDNCMFQSGRKELEAIFFYDGPPVIEMGRAFTRCPRCSSLNTRSFAQLKQEGSDAALWGLERIVKRHPRSVFEVKRTS